MACGPSERHGSNFYLHNIRASLLILGFTNPLSLAAKSFHYSELRGQAADSPIPLPYLESQSLKIGNFSTVQAVLFAVVIVSSPWLFGPVSRTRRRIASAIPTKPSTEKIHI